MSDKIGNLVRCSKFGKYLTWTTDEELTYIVHNQDKFWEEGGWIDDIDICEWRGEFDELYGQPMQWERMEGVSILWDKKVALVHDPEEDNRSRVAHGLHRIEFKSDRHIWWKIDNDVSNAIRKLKPWPGSKL